MPKEHSIPKILLFDIETSPNIAYMWGKYEQDALGDFIQERMIISVAWKWLGKKEVNVKSLPDYCGYKPITPKTKNKKLIEFLHSLLSSADILVAQNGDNFDIKMANAEFAQYGLKPPPPYKTIDTLKIARTKFRFNSNKLDDIGTRLGLGRKLKTGGFDLWKGCIEGSPKAWAKMIKYNKRDVVLLEKIYLRIRPWMKSHPNMNVLDLGHGCSVCRSTRIRKRGWQLMPNGRKQRHFCNDCGNWMFGPFISSALCIR